MQGYLEDEMQHGQQSCPLWSGHPADANFVLGNSTRWWYVYVEAIACLWSPYRHCGCACSGNSAVHLSMEHNAVSSAQVHGII